MQQHLTLSKRTELKPYQPREFIPYAEMTDANIFNSNGDLVFDSECFQNFYLIAFKQVSTDRVITLIPPFDCRKLSFILHNYRCIGFNSLRYDIPLLWAAYKNQNLKWLKEVSNALVSGNWWQEICKEYQIQVFPTNHIDLMNVCPGKGSLKLYGARLHTKRIQELPFDHRKDLTDYEKEVVTDYCINGDLEATQAIFLFNKERLELREHLGRKYNTNLMSKSDAQMAEAIMISEITKKTGARPKKADLTEDYNFFYQVPNYLQFASPELNKLLDRIKVTKFSLNEWGYINFPEEFKNKISLQDFTFKFGVGGLHSCEQNISYKADDEHLIVDKDVASYYPRIISNLRLYPEHLGPIFLEVFDGLTDQRLIAKKLKQFAEDKGLKITINGASGKFNSEHSVMFSPRCYVQMTLTGQLSVLMLAEILIYNGIKIISANTDGIVIYCKKSEYEKLTYWVSYWEKTTNYQTEETQYKSYYSRDVNAYFAVKSDISVKKTNGKLLDENDRIKVKGPYSEVGSQTGTKLDNNPITLICSDAIKNLLSINKPIEETIKECSDITRFVTVRNVKGGAHKNGEYLGKVVRWAFFKNEFGTINYVESGNKVPQTEGARALMDLPENFPSDLDYDRYIAETRQMLYDIDYLQRPRQVKFFERNKIGY